VLGGLDGLAEYFLRGGCLVGRLRQQQLTFESVEFGLLEALVVLSCAIAKPSSSARPRVLEPAGLRAGVAQGAKLDRKDQLGASGAPGMDALANQWYRFLQLTLVEHSGALVEGPRSDPPRKPLFS